MPSWKKIIVSGSNAELNQLTATSYGGNISGSSTSTGSFGHLKVSGAGQDKISLLGGTNQFINFGDADDYNIGAIKYIHGSSNQMQFITNNTMGFFITNNQDIGMKATGKFYFDGGYNTFFEESSADNVKFTIGGVEILDITETGVSGSATSTGSFGHLELANRDTDASFEFGRAHIGYIGHSDMAGFSHVDNDSATNFALAQSAAGKTIVQAKSGQPIAFKINNSDKVQISSDGNLGVGIETATEKLHVVGNVFATGNISGSATSTGSFGELIVDSNGTFGGDLAVGGNITAQNFIVSSSVTSIEYQSLSGSTIFGDTADDTHTFLGDIISGSAQSTGSFGAVTIDGSPPIHGLSNAVQGGSGGAFGFNTAVPDGAGITIVPGNDGKSSTALTNNFGLGITHPGTNGTYSSLQINTGVGRVLWVGNDGNIEMPAPNATISGSATSTGSFGKLLGDGSNISNIVGAVASASISTRLTTEEGNVDTLQGRTLTAGTGLTGGGTLASDRTFNVIGGDGITANANDMAITAAQTTITSIYNTGLKIGRAATDTFIDFGTDDSVKISAANTVRLHTDTAGVHVTGTLDVSGNAIIEGNLTVNGDTTTISTSNILVQDAFGFFATGSAGTNVDAGIIVQSGSFVDSGSALYHDISSERWSVGKGIASTATNVPDSKWGGFVATVYTASASPVGSSPKYGVGEIHVDDDGEIYIYS